MRRWILALALVSCTKEPAPDDRSVAIYLAAARAQLAFEARQKSEIVGAMVSVDPAQPPSVRVQTILESARQLSSVAWHMTFLRRGELPIPPSCAEAHARISELHRQRDDALKELLLYWTDRDPAHLERGTLAYRSSDAVAEAAAAALAAHQ